MSTLVGYLYQKLLDTHGKKNYKHRKMLPMNNHHYLDLKKKKKKNLSFTHHFLLKLFHFLNFGGQGYGW